MVSMDSEIPSIRAVGEAGMKNEERDWLTATEGDKCMMMRKTWKWSLGIDGGDLRCAPRFRSPRRHPSQEQKGHADCRPSF